jgi:hypothetical protein
VSALCSVDHLADLGTVLLWVMLDGARDPDTPHCSSSNAYTTCNDLHIFNEDQDGCRPAAVIAFRSGSHFPCFRGWRLIRTQTSSR